MATETLETTWHRIVELLAKRSALWVASIDRTRQEAARGLSIEAQRFNHFEAWHPEAIGQVDCPVMVELLDAVRAVGVEIDQAERAGRTCQPLGPELPATRRLADAAYLAGLHVLRSVDEASWARLERN